jgi:hypothetical protein
MVPVSSKFSYFTALPLSEDDIKEYVEEPVAALPPNLISTLAPVCIALVPYLEKLNGKDKTDGPGDTVSFEKPPENRLAAAGSRPRCCSPSRTGRSPIITTTSTGLWRNWPRTVPRQRTATGSTACSEKSFVPAYTVRWTRKAGG